MPAPRSDSLAAEAARYALLRRLAPAMRHHLVVNLQPIGMVHEVLERRLGSAEPDLAQVHDGVRKMHGFSRAALQSCHDVMGWLAPDDAAGTTPHEGVAECVGLLATSLSFQGFSLRNDVPELQRHLRRSAVRTMVAATLIHLTDHLAPPASVALSLHPWEGGVHLDLLPRAAHGDPGLADAPVYRRLDWADVQALAQDCETPVSRQGAGVRITFVWLPAPAEA